MKTKKELRKNAKAVVEKDFIQEIFVQDILNHSSSLKDSTDMVAQIIIGGIDVQIWKDGSKYKIVKEILPHAKTAEKDSVETMTKDAAIKKMTELITKAF